VIATAALSWKFSTGAPEVLLTARQAPHLLSVALLILYLYSQFLVLRWCSRRESGDEEIALFLLMSNNWILHLLLSSDQSSLKISYM